MKRSGSSGSDTDKNLFIILGVLIALLLLFLLRCKMNEKKEKFTQIEEKCTSCSA